MVRAAFLVVVIVTSACGAYGRDPSAPGGPNACFAEGNTCGRSSQCCSAWCVNRVCERWMGKRDQRDPQQVSPGRSLE
jgi:hypothetical protein